MGKGGDDRGSGEHNAETSVQRWAAGARTRQLTQPLNQESHSRCEVEAIRCVSAAHHAAGPCNGHVLPTACRRPNERPRDTSAGSIHASVLPVASAKPHLHTRDKPAERTVDRGPQRATTTFLVRTLEVRRRSVRSASRIVRFRAQGSTCALLDWIRDGANATDRENSSLATISDLLCEPFGTDENRKCCLSW